MSLYIGIDGGGSKTRFACFDERGKLLREHLAGGCYYRQLGADAVEKTIIDGIKAVTDGLGGELAAVSFGMPGYGEALAEDESFAARLAQKLAPAPFFAANDVAMAYHGAFAGAAGILLVSGTGSMAWGQDERGVQRRCGGWSEHFGDEGSGYWVGREAIALFSKQSDGRLPKTVFYRLFKEYMSSPMEEDDLALVPRIEALFASRSQVAAIHRVLLKAAELGDSQAVGIYERAAVELASIVKGMRGSMDFASAVPVSWVGGMFNCEELLLEPFKRNVEAAFAASFHPPILGPCQGAALFAAAKLPDRAAFEILRDGMLEEVRKNV